MAAFPEKMELHTVDVDHSLAMVEIAVEFKHISDSQTRNDEEVIVATTKTLCPAITKNEINDMLNSIDYDNLGENEYLFEKNDF